MFKEEIRNQKFSLLGALYLEKIIRKLKAFLQYLSERPQPNIIEDLVEVAQLLACENLDEIDNHLREQGYSNFKDPDRFKGLPPEKKMQTSEIAELILCRVDLALTNQQVYEFLTELI